MTRAAVAWLLVAIGAALLAAGLVLGFSSIKRMGTDCGSALGGYNSSAATVADYTRAFEGEPGLSVVADACSSAVSDRTPIAWALLVPGGILLLSSILVRPGRPVNDKIGAAPE